MECNTYEVFFYSSAEKALKIPVEYRLNVRENDFNADHYIHTKKNTTIIQHA